MHTLKYYVVFRRIDLMTKDDKKNMPKALKENLNSKAGNGKKEDKTEQKQGYGKFYIIGVIVFSILLIGALEVIAVVQEPDRVALDKLGDYEGEEVVCEGVVIDVQDAGSYATTLLIYQKGTLAKVDIEEKTDMFKVDDIVRVRGEVFKSGKQYVLQVATPSAIEIKGKGPARPIDLGTLDRHKNEYVAIEGVVVGFELYEQGGKARLLGLPHLDQDTYAGNATCEAQLSEWLPNISVTDKLNISGIVRERDGAAYLYVYHLQSDALTENYWKPRSLTLGQLAELVVKSPKDYEDFPINTTGYLRYEPTTYPRLTVSEAPEDGFYTLIGDTTGIAVPVLHKGDLVSLLGTVTYDQETLRFVMTPKEVHLLQSHSPWNLTMELLGKEYYQFENANITVNGTVEEDGLDGYMLAGFGYELRIREYNASAFESDLALAEGTDIRVSGCLRFDENSLEYYIEARMVH